MTEMTEMTEITEIKTKYGSIYYDQWYDAYGHNKKINNGQIFKLDGYYIKFLNDIKKPCVLKGIRSDDIYLNSRECFKICYNKKIITVKMTHLILASGFPNIEANETVDHVNDDPTDSRLVNLQWMSWSENSRKGQKKSVTSTNANGGRHGIYIEMFFNNEKIGIFRSIDKCAQHIIDNHHLFSKNVRSVVPKLKTAATKIREAQKRNGSYKGCTFKVINQDTLDGEIWKIVPHKFYLNQQKDIYEVSTYGRLRGPRGVQYGESNRKGKYTAISMNKKKYYIHNIVWETFHGPVEEGKEILHDDSVALNLDGTYKNYLAHLRIGTRSENMIERYNTITPRDDEDANNLSIGHI